MKREIKFRGKSKTDGEWFYGNLFDKDTSGRTHIGTTKKGCLNIDPDTVGQYIGKKDKNGNEIYEGDILGCANPKIKHLVFYNERQGRFMAALNGNLDDDFWLCGFDSERWNASKEIIGNIYDNPELITEK